MTDLILQFYREKGRWPKGNVQDEMQTWHLEVLRERAELQRKVTRLESIINSALAQKLQAMGYDLDELEAENPYNAWMKGNGDES